jgi:hypothetical protein
MGENQGTALSPSHKRWCFYWYYAVSFFQMGGNEAQELPPCFIAQVQRLFPDLKGEYTGFKTKEEHTKVD